MKSISIINCLLMMVISESVHYHYHFGCQKYKFSTSEFHQIVKNNPSVVAYFTSYWCGPCSLISNYIKGTAIKNGVKLI